jgi:ABC-type sugar transport system substrate-binding protein
MNKRFYVLTTMLMLISLVLASCAPAVAPTAAPAEPQVEQPTEAAVNQPAEEDLFIGMVLHSSIPFTEQMRKGAEWAAKDYGVEFEAVAPATVDPEAAMAMFEGLVSKGAEGILLDPAPPDAWTSTIQKAVDAGVVVTNVDNQALPESGMSLFVGPEEFDAAKTLGELMIEQLNKEGITSGKVVFAICAPGYPSQEQRASGFAAAFEGKSEWELVGPLDSGHNVELDYAFWESTTVQHSDAVAYVGNCAFDGPNLAKIKQASGGEWLIGTFDLEPETLQAINDGVIAVAIGANPWLSSYLATRAMIEHFVYGKDMPSGWIDSGPEPVTSDNVEEFLEREENPEGQHEFFLEIIENDFSDLNSLVKAFPQ